MRGGCARPPRWSWGVCERARGGRALTRALTPPPRSYSPGRFHYEDDLLHSLPTIFAPTIQGWDVITGPIVTALSNVTLGSYTVIQAAPSAARDCWRSRLRVYALLSSGALGSLRAMVYAQNNVSGSTFSTQLYFVFGPEPLYMSVADGPSVFLVDSQAMGFNCLRVSSPGAVAQQQHGGSAVQ